MKIGKYFSRLSKHYWKKTTSKNILLLSFCRVTRKKSNIFTLYLNQCCFLNNNIDPTSALVLTVFTLVWNVTKSAENMYIFWIFGKYFKYSDLKVFTSKNYTGIQLVETNGREFLLRIHGSFPEEREVFVCLSKLRQREMKHWNTMSHSVPTCQTSRGASSHCLEGMTDLVLR